MIISGTLLVRIFEGFVSVLEYVVKDKFNFINLSLKGCVVRFVGHYLSNLNLD